MIPSSNRREASSWPVALSIAGSDSSGGAGIQADLKTFAALGVYGTSAITALTAQNTRGIEAIEPVSAAMVAAQIRVLISDFPVRAVKTGMLVNAAIIEAVLAELPESLPLVVDPVMLSSSGTRLLSTDACSRLRTDLLPRALLVTPNMAEAAALLNEPVAEGLEARCRQAQCLLELGPQAVLLKGGHASGADALDIYCDADGIEYLHGPRINTRNTHGTGCTLAAAITAGLARNLSSLAACRAAKHYLQQVLASSTQLQLGGGSGPLHHFYHFSDGDTHDES